MGENNGRVTLPSRKGATGALPCPEVHRGALAPALAEHPHPPPPISVAANTPPPHSYRKSFLPTQRLNAQCAPQWQAHVVMGRYKGIGMPKAKKKKVMQAPALETNIMITLTAQEAAGSSSKQVGPVACARVPLSHHIYKQAMKACSQQYVATSGKHRIHFCHVYIHIHILLVHPRVPQLKLSLQVANECISLPQLCYMLRPL